METEHGIVFNKPYCPSDAQGDSFHLPYVSKSLTKSQAYQDMGASSMDKNLMLIPVSVIGDNVLCLALVNRHTQNATEWEPPQYQGGQPQRYYTVEDEYTCYYSMPPIKEFIDKWKLIN